MRVRDAEFVKGAARWEQLPGPELPEVAFVGRSNVGKSSLLNMLLGRKRLARTSRSPGKTQQLNYYRINGKLYFVDLPGYGYAKVSKKERERWGRLIGQYLTERPSLRLVIHLVDSRHPPQQLDEDVMALMRGSPVPYLIALTKTDKLSGNKRAESVRRVEQVLTRGAMDVPVVLTSAKDRRGYKELWRWIRDLTGV